MAFLYDSAARRPPMIEEWIALVRYRDLLVELILNGLKSRYKRSVLGVAWTLLNPLVTMGVTTIAFARVFKSDVMVYPVYVLSGVLLWGFFSQSTAQAMHGLVYVGTGLLKRVSLPRAIFPVAMVGTGTINLLLGMVPLAIISFALGLRPSAALLFLPVALALTVAFVLGTSLLLSALAVRFTDVLEIFQAGVTAMFYVTPVLYPESVIPERWRWLLTLNPMTHLLETFRRPIYLGELPPARTLALATAAALLSLLLGWWVYTRKADDLVTRA
jgi:homopolymeric O-antigen transport system permease protein